MTTPDTDLLAELIRRKLDCLVRLRAMGQKQIELVRTDRMTDLLDVLGSKQRVLTELQQIERALDPFRGQDPDRRRWRSADSRQACAQKLKQCESLLGEIVRQERQSERELIQRRDEVAQQLQGFHLASQARGAYAAQSDSYEGRLDLLSEC